MKKRLSKADFTYVVFDVEGVDKKFISIQDQDLGGRSVTNDIENCIKDICDENNLKQEDCLVVYCDSDGIWDAYDTKINDFVVLRCETVMLAVKEYLKKLK